MQNNFDYIVIGAGSAGCVVATRLSQNPDIQVLLLEAGGQDDHEDIAIPAKWPTLFPGELDWGHQTIAQKHCNNRIVHCPRAKMLGGCHSHNANAWVHGHPGDFDNWAYQGNPGWDFASVLEIYKKIEDWAPGANEYRGAGGPLYIEPPQEPNPIAQAFVEAGREIGFPVVEDNNGPHMEGMSFFNFTIKDGKRNSVANAYLHPAAKRNNLTILTHAQVHSLCFKGTQCIGVEYSLKNDLKKAIANKEVTLCAGAINSPQILMLSGIGPQQHLNSLNIPVIADVPGVGQNLQDHILLAGINYECNGPLPEPKNNGAESTMWWKSNSKLLYPDIQPVILEFPFATPELADKVPENCYAIAPGLVRPAACGQIKLTAANPKAALAIDMNYLGCEADIKALSVAVDICRELGAAKAFSKFCKREIMPGKLNKKKMIEFIRMSTTTFFHPTSTCKMGIDKMSVVDPQLKVYGTDGLRVADASIMPDVTTGNTNAPSVMIGEKAAQMIMDSWSTFS